jgi:hypothetical protein
LLLIKPGQKDLAMELIQAHPELKVLLCTGGTQEVASSHDGWTRDLPVLQKPYDPEILLRTVQSALERQRQTS